MNTFLMVNSNSFIRHLPVPPAFLSTSLMNAARKGNLSGRQQFVDKTRPDIRSVTTCKVTTRKLIELSLTVTLQPIPSYPPTKLIVSASNLFTFAWNDKVFQTIPTFVKVLGQWDEFPNKNAKSWYISIPKYTDCSQLLPACLRTYQLTRKPYYFA